MSYEPNHKDPDNEFDDSDLVRRSTGDTEEEEEEVQALDDDDILDEEDSADEGDLDLEPDDSYY
jgi:hypothetical protein